MVRIRAVISAVLLLIFSVWSATAQDNCDLDLSGIIQRVTDECAEIGENQVCYGNRNVSVTPRVNTIDFMFENPGDRADLHNIQSLVVDAVDAQEDTWGVAQMRLLVGSDRGLQDITMLLFGEFDMENAVEDTDTVELQVVTRERAIHREPDVNSAQIEIVDSGAVLVGVARVEDSSWIRVENPLTRVVGWVENSGVLPTNQALSVGILPVQDETTPYFGAMQAFYFENGNSNIGCDSVESDGLLIQTPEGEARISLLINEVSIELVGRRNDAGENVSGTAFIQANPQIGQDMSVNVLEGSATVQTEEGQQVVQPGQQTTIPISVDLRPSGAPEEPIAFEEGTINLEPLLPVVSAPRNNDNNNLFVDNSSGNSSNNTNTSGVSVPIGGGSGNSSGDGSNNASGTSSSSGSFDVSSSNGSSNSDSGSSGSGQGSGLPLTNNNSNSGNDGGAFGFGQQGNIIALSLAVAAGAIVMWFIVWYTRRNRN